jgi:protein neuralized
VESFCKAIVFTHRPVRVHEKIYIRFVEKSESWSGSIRFGFSAVDPRQLAGGLPKYACPDLTNKSGFWAKALAEKFADKDSVMYYYVNNSGDVVFGVNGEDKGVFFSGVDTRRQLWGLVDVYGNSNVIELVDPRRSLNNMLVSQQQQQHQQQQLLQQQQEIAYYQQQQQILLASRSPAPIRHHHQHQHVTAATTTTAAEVHVQQQQQRLRRSESCGRLGGGGNNNEVRSSYYGTRRLARAAFHRACRGQNVTLNATANVATRSETEFCNGYVFLDSPLQPGESLVIRILETESTYIGSLAFGLTAADPRTVAPSALPEDSELLLQRPEYWVLSKDVLANPHAGDELCFTLGLDGAVLCSVNNGPDRVLFHSDISLPTRPFVDIYGVAQKIQLLGVAPAAATASSSRTPSLVRRPTTQLKVSPPRPKSSCSLSSSSAHSPKSLPPSLDISHDSGMSGLNMMQNECVICYEADVDCVLYACGHMCMCFSCAVQQFDTSGECPLCRATIRDVIRTYRA